MKPALNRFFLVLFVGSIIGGIAYYAYTTKSVGGGEELLKQRVIKEWDAKVKRNWGMVHDLTTEAFKKKVDKQTFITGANINVLEFAIQEVKISEPGKAIAVVRYKVLQEGYEFNFTSREEWVQENGDWYLNLLPILGTPMSSKKS